MVAKFSSKILQSTVAKLLKKRIVAKPMQKVFFLIGVFAKENEAIHAGLGNFVKSVNHLKNFTNI